MTTRHDATRRCGAGRRNDYLLQCVTGTCASAPLQSGTVHKLRNALSEGWEVSSRRMADTVPYISRVSPQVEIESPEIFPEILEIFPKYFGKIWKYFQNFRKYFRIIRPLGNKAEIFRKYFGNISRPSISKLLKTHSAQHCRNSSPARVSPSAAAPGLSSG